MTSQEAAKKAGTSAILARRWAKKNGVTITNTGYQWTGEDLERFLNRNKKVGRPKE